MHRSSAIILPLLLVWHADSAVAQSSIPPSGTVFEFAVQGDAARSSRLPDKEVTPARPGGSNAPLPGNGPAKGSNLSQKGKGVPLGPQPPDQVDIFHQTKPEAPRAPAAAANPPPGPSPGGAPRSR